MSNQEPKQKKMLLKKPVVDEIDAKKFDPKATLSPQKRGEDPASPSKVKYMPSRYGTAEIYHSTNVIKRTALLHTLEDNMNELDQQISKSKPEAMVNRLKEVKSYQPPLTVFKPNEFKKKPIKKSDMEFQSYQEIFVSPKEQALHKLQEKEKRTGSQSQLSEEQKNEKASFDTKPEKKPKFAFDDGNSLLQSPRSKSKLTQVSRSMKALNRHSVELSNSVVHDSRVGLRHPNEKELTRHISMPDGTLLAESKINETEIVNALENTVVNDGNEEPKRLHNERLFFDQQIQVQPPDTPNFNPASPLTPGNGWAPSIPLVKLVDVSKSNLKDLLLRAKAGMQAGDTQKEAHLSFYLAMVHENRKSYKEAIKYYKKFFACAQTMEDKIGMALALNRLGVNYFNEGKFDMSEKFHQKNLELSDRENSFAGFYNLAIANRSNGNLEEALNNFQEALEWAFEFNDGESECLSYGQIGLTCRDMKSFEEALDKFKKCYNLGLKLKNHKLQLDCLLNMTKIVKAREQEDTDNYEIYNNAYECARGLNDKKTANICLVNMGVIGGLIRYDEFRGDILNEFPESSEIRYIDPNQIQEEDEQILPQQLENGHHEAQIEETQIENAAELHIGHHEPEVDQHEQKEIEVNQAEPEENQEKPEEEQTKPNEEAPLENQTENTHAVHQAAV